jgi:hypothetical protein
LIFKSTWQFYQVLKADAEQAVWQTALLQQVPEKHSPLYVPVSLSPDLPAVLNFFN